MSLTTDADLRCGGILTKDNVIITSPDRDGDGAYDTDLSCTWLIVAPKRFIIGINFDYDAFGIEESPEGGCGYDSLTVRSLFLANTPR